MGMTMVRATMEKVIDMPIVFLLATVMTFLVVIAIIAAIGYAIACAESKKTEMTGIMRVGVELNSWHDDSRCKNTTVLHYGEFWISMKDPVALTENRLDAKLNWKEKAFCRQYEVSLLLQRFLMAYHGAGFVDDPSAQLLDCLLKKESFCRALGKCSYKNDKKGLAVTDAFAYKKHPNGKKVSVYNYGEIDGEAAKAFGDATGCAVETICITLEYQK